MWPTYIVHIVIFLILRPWISIFPLFAAMPLFLQVTFNTASSAISPLPSLSFWSWLQQYQLAAQDAEPHRFISTECARHLALISPVNDGLPHCLVHRKERAYTWHLLGNNGKTHSKNSTWWRLCCISIWDNFYQKHTCFRRKKTLSFPTVLTKITEWHK